MDTCLGSFKARPYAIGQNSVTCLQPTVRMDGKYGIPICLGGKKGYINYLKKLQY